MKEPLELLFEPSPFWQKSADLLSTSDVVRLFSSPSYYSEAMLPVNHAFLGKLSNKGTEMEGFLSALYLVGANAVVSCLWPVNDKLAPIFSSQFCNHLKEVYSYKMNNFVRAKAFTKCMRSLINSWDEKDLACYTYYGAP